MKRCCMIFILVCVISLLLCACFTRGPYPAPVSESLENIEKIDLLDGSGVDRKFSNDSYKEVVIYSLEDNEIPAFIKGLVEILFYKPNLEPSRHLGEIAVRIYYKDGTSDLIGSNCHYYLDAESEIIKLGVAFPDEEAFYALFSQFVDSQLLPRK